MKRFIILMFILETCCLEAQMLNSISYVLNNAEWLKSYENGYVKTVDGESLTYSSIFPHVKQALIVRAKDNYPSINWITEKNELNRFIFLCGLGVNLGKGEFAFEMNGKELIEFELTDKKDWTRGNSQCVLAFHGVLKDACGDWFGFLTLELKKQALMKEIKFSISSRDSLKEAWVMIFEYENLYDDIQKMINESFIVECRWDHERNELKYKALGKEVRVEGVQMDDSEKWRSMKDPEFPIIITVNEVKLSVPNPENWVRESIWKRNGILYNNVSGDGKSRISFLWNLEGWREKSEMFNHVDSLLEKIALISSSHQDIAWMDTPEKCKLDRSEKILKPAMELLERDSSYRYSAEQALMLKEFLDLNPAYKEEATRLTREGKIEWGATFNQPYEGLQYGENLVRQLYLGKLWLKKMIPGYDSRTAWNVDVPSRTWQMPQILAKGGVDYLIVSRMEKGLYYWEAPDGSRIGVYSPGHYHGDSEILRKDMEETVFHLPEELKFWGGYKDVPSWCPFLFSSDMAEAADFSPLIEMWENSRSHTGGRAPKIEYHLAQDVMNECFSGDKNYPVIKGERPNVWLYIHGPGHEKAIQVFRKTSRDIVTAEKLGVFVDWSFGIKSDLDDLTSAWENLIYPDHGWGGKNGEITDSVFKSVIESSRDTVNEFIQRRIKPLENKQGKDAFSLLNLLEWKRRGIVELALESPVIIRGEGDEILKSDYVPAQFILAPQEREGLVVFNSSKIAPWSGGEFSMKKGALKTIFPKKNVNEYENEYYRLIFKEGKLISIFDKETRENIFEEKNGVHPGEVVQLDSPGNGAGEFADVQLPLYGSYKKHVREDEKWELVFQGDVCDILQMKGKWENAEIIRQTWLFHEEKRIDFKVRVDHWEGGPDKEFRMVFPPSGEKNEIAYEVPFGRVKLGEDEMDRVPGERYLTDPKNIKYREVLDWVMMNQGEKRTIIKTPAPVVDFSGEWLGMESALSFVLFASRKSCHWEGNRYSQKGEHYFEFSLFSGLGDEEKFQRKAWAAANPLLVLPGKTSGGKSIFKLEGKGVRLSTLKRSEDGRGFVARVYESLGNDVEAAAIFPFDLKEAALVNMIEEFQENIPIKKDRFQFSLAPHEIKTFFIR